MNSKTPTRNRLAKKLPREWQDHLADAGVPRRKYTAIVRATCTGGRVIEEMIIEEGWIIALTREGLTGNLDRHIDLDPRTIQSIEIVQHI